MPWLKPHHDNENPATYPISKNITIEINGFRIRPLVCYDLRFPVWSRNKSNNEYDCLIYIANWPAVRSQAWTSLLQARAIENLSYCIGVNRVGEDANGNIYPGHSAAYDALGRQMSQDLNKKEGIAEVTMELDPLRSLRKRLNFLADRDEFVWDQKLD